MRRTPWKALWNNDDEGVWGFTRLWHCLDQHNILTIVIPSGLKPSFDSEAQAPCRLTPAGPHQKSLQEATRAQKPPVPISSETVSKRVLSAQPRYQPIKVDDIMAKAGTLTWVVKSMLMTFLCPGLLDTFFRWELCLRVEKIKQLLLT